MLLGAPGVGKTHVAVAIGRQAILTGYSVLFVPAPTLVAQLAKAHGEGRLADRLLHFGKPKVLIIDELGYLPFEPRSGAGAYTRGAYISVSATTSTIRRWRCRRAASRTYGSRRSTGTCARP